VAASTASKLWAPGQGIRPQAEFRHAPHIVQIGLVSGTVVAVEQPDESVGGIAFHVVFHPRSGISGIVGCQNDVHVGGRRRSQGGPRRSQGGPGFRETPLLPFRCDGHSIAAVPRTSGGVESENPLRSAGAPVGLAASRVALVVEGDVAVEDNLAAGVKVFAQRAVGRIHDHAGGLIGDAVVHPFLELIRVEDLIAGGLEIVADLYRDVQIRPVRGIILVPIGREKRSRRLAPNVSQYDHQGQTQFPRTHVISSCQMGQLLRTTSTCLMPKSCCICLT